MMSLRDELLASDDETLSAQCRQDFHKASGRGGQKVNKTSSAVRLTHLPSGITVVCSESRSQRENRRIALKKLRKTAALSLRQEPDDAPDTGAQRETPPSLSNPARYLPWLARILDHLYAGRLAPGYSASVLRKLLKRDPEVWRYLSERKTCGGFAILLNSVRAKSAGPEVSDPHLREPVPANDPDIPVCPSESPSPRPAG